MKNLFKTYKFELDLSDLKTRKKVIRIAVCIVAVIAVLVGYLIANGRGADGATLLGDDDSLSISDSEAASSKDSSSKSTTRDSETGSSGYIYVDIGGAVASPCVVCVKKGSRIDDAIREAGGLLPDASTKSINRASKLEDGEKLYIPTVAEETATTASGNTGAAGAAVGAIDSEGRVNLNLATNDELQTLSGVGPATATKIVEYRESNGGFKKIEDLKNVSGIGEKTFEKLKSKIYV